jgi:two-component system, OmpR family, KDP operon response regulator KdpE
VLASHLGLVVTHQQLIKEIWGRALGDNVQYLRMLVRKLRQKIEVDPNQPKFLITESGVGYRLERHK